MRGDRSCLAGRGDGVDGVGQALFVWCREHEGGSDARVTQSSPSGVPVKIEQSGVGEHARDRVEVRGPGKFVDNGRVGVGHVQFRKARTGHEARVGDADGGSREVVVAVVVVFDESPAECVVSCARVVVGAVGVFALVGSGCAVRSQRLARVRASGLVASLRDEAVAGVVIACPSTQQPCGYPTSVKRYGGATRR